MRQSREYAALRDVDRIVLPSSVLPSPVIPRDHLSLGAAQRVRLVCEVLVTYGRVRWELRRRTLPEVVRRLRCDPHTRVPPPGEMGSELSSRRIAYAVAAVLERLPTDSRCLMRSLVLTRLMARRGLASSLVIGVVTAPGFSAHAWVEHRGAAVLPNYGDVMSRLVEL